MQKLHRRLITIKIILQFSKFLLDRKNKNKKNYRYSKNAEYFIYKINEMAAFIKGYTATLN